MNNATSQPGVPCKQWSAIFLAGEHGLRHELWCAVIRAVASAILADRDPASLLSAEDLEDAEYAPEALTDLWLHESVPSGADLAWVLDELDYFRGIDLAWYEKVSLSGQACGYASDVVYDLRDILSGHIDAQDAVTEESVEAFYGEWSARFKQRVIREAESIKADKLE